MSHQILSLEDYEVGQKGASATRTVTEADIVHFAGITEDYSLPHMDRHAMAESPYGSRVAHGLLGSSLVTGMLSLRAPHVLGRGVPGGYFYRFDSNYRAGLNLDDTIRIHWEVVDTTADTPFADYGRVTTAFQVVKQDGEAVYDGTLETLVRRSHGVTTDLELPPVEPWEVVAFQPEPGKAYYIEDLPLGAGGETEGRTVTETDIVNFAGLTGDYGPQFVNEEFARQGMFGSRISHGLFVFSSLFGLWISHGPAHPRAPATSGAMVAGHLNDQAAFVGPVRIGDTIHCRYQTLATRSSKSKPELGLVTTGLQAINQRGEVVLEGSTILMGVSRAARSG